MLEQSLEPGNSRPTTRDFFDLSFRRSFADFRSLPENSRETSEVSPCNPRKVSAFVSLKKWLY